MSGGGRLFQPGRAIWALAAMFAMAAPLRAQSVEFAGTTSGCFYTGTPANDPACSPLASAPDLVALVYQAGSFDVNTFSGFAGSGGTTQTLGNMTLADGSNDFTGQEFPTRRDVLRALYRGHLRWRFQTFFTAALTGSSVSNDGALAESTLCRLPVRLLSHFVRRADLRRCIYAFG